MAFLSILTKIFGDKAQRDVKEVMPVVEKIKTFENEMRALSHDDLRARTHTLRDKLQATVADDKARIAELRAQIEDTEIDQRQRLYDEIDKLDKRVLDTYETELERILPEVFAIVKETAYRFANNDTITVKATDFDRKLALNHDFVEIDGDNAIYSNEWEAGGNMHKWDMVHYDVQLIGGTVLHHGKIAEMATGEGKTLVATLPVFLNALTGNGVHVVTVNDYLAKRDAEWMGPLYMFHGLSVDCIDKYQPHSPERRAAYNCDITFGTNNEFGFDYLRDNMAIHPADLVQRSHNYAIVDEVDSVLIDDARTPLIISGPVPKGEDQMFEEFNSRVQALVNKQTTMAAALLNEARAKIGSDKKEEEEAGCLALFRCYKAMPRSKTLIKYLSEPGIKQKMIKTEEFYMQENNKNMHIATDPLYFIIDEKHNSVELTDKGVDALTGVSEDPQFFVMPDVGSEIAEIEKSNLDAKEKQEKKDAALLNYSIKSERIHTVTQLLKAYTLFFKDDQYVVQDNQVLIVDEQTGRIMDGRRYSDGLHQALEAKEHVKVEAATQTFATITLQNYFRMYHKLAGMTGTAETEAGELWDIYKLDVVVIPTNRPIARLDMQDRIYKTKKEKYYAVIDEIVSLVSQGRPVLVGTTSVEISEVLSRMLTNKKIKHNVLNAKLHQKEADIVAEAGRPGTVTIATNMAGRGTDIKLTPEVREAGGLAIIGTERHESRRVDRQLRGRSGRQGDPGSSVFYVSLEDNLMRLFGSERISKVMDRLGFQEGERIEHSMISKSIEKAQKKVEENNFGIRKRLLEYDDVMNKQRTVIYSRRRHALMGERVGVDIVNTLYDTLEAVVNEASQSSDYQLFRDNMLKYFALDVNLTEEEFRSSRPAKIVDKVSEQVYDVFKRKMDTLAATVHPVVSQVFENQGAQYENILIPVTDGRKIYNIPVNLKDAYESESKALIKEFEKIVLLVTIDEAWKENLRELDELRTSVQNATYEQKDPLVIYKVESSNLFMAMIDECNRKITSILMRAQIPVQDPDKIRRAEKPRRADYSRMSASKQDVGSALQRNAAADRDTRERQVTAPIRAEKTVGRNDPCPCGSGKKYKNCCGRNVPEA
ncbi:MAG: preprotein translocase subunit SecA [Paludibacteraceae bacterium]|nr:preprotein translocase subunit SecA [Paludibacteraceae bacterium]